MKCMFSFTPADSSWRWSHLLPTRAFSLPQNMISTVWLRPCACRLETGAQHCDATLNVTSLSLTGTAPSSHCSDDASSWHWATLERGPAGRPVDSVLSRASIYQQPHELESKFFLVSLKVPEAPSTGWMVAWELWNTVLWALLKLWAHSRCCSELQCILQHSSSCHV